MTNPAPHPVYQIEAMPTGFAIQRNGRHLMTPAGKAFILPTGQLAEAIAAEWRAQGAKPNHAEMPLNQLASTTLDIVAGKRDTIVAELSRYAETELLCHRAESPPALAERQHKAWQPLLDWAWRRFDARLNTGAGIMPIAQNAPAIAALRRAIAAYDDFRLAGLQQAVTVSGSLVIGLALAENEINAAAAFAAAECEASFQIEKWGEDPASAARQSKIKAELAVCENWFRFLRI